MHSHLNDAAGPLAVALLAQLARPPFFPRFLFLSPCLLSAGDKKGRRKRRRKESLQPESLQSGSGSRLHKHETTRERPGPVGAHADHTRGRTVSTSPPPLHACGASRLASPWRCECPVCLPALCLDAATVPPAQLCALHRASSTGQAQDPDQTTSRIVKRDSFSLGVKGNPTS